MLKKLQSILFFCCTAALSLQAVAQAPTAGGFAAAASPPRFELESSPGQTIREVLTIHNFGQAPVQYRIRSNGWTFTEAGQMLFNDALRADSCRPWLRLERHKVTVMPQQPRKFRFELYIPEDAQTGECTFAILIEGIEDEITTEVGQNIQMPVTGRIGVIIYLAIGDVKPELEIINQQVIEHNGQWLPSLQIENRGLAHGRMDGTLSGKDASGNEFDLSVSSLPILAEQRRQLTLSPSLPGPLNNQHVEISYPIAVKGTLFWRHGEFDLNTIFRRE